MDKLTQLRTEQGEIQTKLDNLANALETGKRSFTEAEKSEFEAMKSRMAEIVAEIKPLQELQELRGKSVAGLPGPLSTKESEEERSLENYSLHNVFSARIQNKRLDGLEGEWAQEVRHRNENAGSDVRSAAGTGFGVPSEAFLSREERAKFKIREKRDYAAGGSTTGGNLIETNLSGLIDALQPYMVLSQLGIMNMRGLSGNVTIPVDDSAPQATFKGETTAAADQSGTFSTATMSPNRLPGYINYTMQMLAQSSTAMEPLVRQRLLRSIANAVQYYAINGNNNSGSSAQPQGVVNKILNSTGQCIESNGVLDWDSICDLEAKLDVQDALIGNTSYLTNSYMRNALKTTAKGASTNDHYLWDVNSPATPLNGYGCAITNHVLTTTSGGPTGSSYSPLIFGNWADMGLGQWGDVYVDLVNANAGSGYYQLVINTFWDTVFLRSSSFTMFADYNVSTSFGS